MGIYIGIYRSIYITYILPIYYIYITYILPKYITYIIARPVDLRPVDAPWTDGVEAQKMLSAIG